ncbi:MAG: hypothetical protein JWQ84_292 [Mucilaginibacter sp.]|nr:hypothetical protein [Mucilaginibacter sp.]MDB5015460.1 hypothetical protein [Mucilaginibacter sp.]
MDNLIFWIALAAYALHILEEFAYDWKTWAQKVLKLDVDWNTFYVTNVVVLFIGVACASVGWAHPTFSLIFPAMMLINALFFHILTYIRSQRKFSPGMITAIFLFLPIGLKCFTLAIAVGVQTKSLLIAAAAGALVMAFLIFLIKTKNVGFFKP